MRTIPDSIKTEHNDYIVGSPRSDTDSVLSDFLSSARESGKLVIDCKVWPATEAHAKTFEDGSKIKLSKDKDGFFYTLGEIKVRMFFICSVMSAEETVH